MAFMPRRAPHKLLAAILVAAPAVLAPMLANAQDTQPPDTSPPSQPIPQPYPQQQQFPGQPLPQQQPFPGQPLGPYTPPPYAAPPYAAPPYGSPPYEAPPSEAPREARTPDREVVPAGNWYGWQTLIAVVPFDIAMFAGLATYGQGAGTGAFIAGFAGRNLAPAVVHMAHGKFGTAFGSVGLHAATSASGLAIAYGIAIALQPPCQPRTPCKDDSLPSGIGYGPVVGSMIGTVLDVVFFAHRQRLSWTASTPPPADAPKVAWSVAPYAAPTPHGSAAGLAATGAF
jgi:hypothetical protein